VGGWFPWFQHEPETVIDELQKKVTDRFGDARFDNGQVLNYIGMTISQPKNGVVIVKQTEYIKKIITQSLVSKTSESPNHPYIHTWWQAEWVATDEGVLHLLWMILVFDFLGYPQQPVTVLQDNQSTMRVCQTGQSKNGRLKHMVVRYNFIHGLQEANIITFEYVKSADMLADIMSKPVAPPIFLKLRKLLLNMPWAENNTKHYVYYLYVIPASNVCVAGVRWM
jgi:hypothetical protein